MADAKREIESRVGTAVKAQYDAISDGVADQIAKNVARIDESELKKEVVQKAKEQIAGFWLWQVRSMDEAIEWAKRCPNPMPGPSELEIRPLYEAEDFGAEFTPELREQEDRLRERLGN